MATAVVADHLRTCDNEGMRTALLHALDVLNRVVPKESTLRHVEPAKITTR